MESQWDKKIRYNYDKDTEILSWDTAVIGMQSNACTRY